MKNLFFVVPAVAILAGCSSVQESSEVPLMEETVPEIVDTPPVVVEEKEDDNSIKGVPEWFVKVPEDTSAFLYGSGTGLSADFQFSMDKAMHQAKIVIGDKVDNRVSNQVKSYIADNSTLGQGTVVQETVKVSKSGFKNIDVSGYKVIEKAVMYEGSKFRSYVLLAIVPSEDRIPEEVVTTTADQTTAIDVQAEVESIRNAVREDLNNL